MFASYSANQERPAIDPTLPKLKSRKRTQSEFGVINYLNNVIIKFKLPRST